MRNTRILAGLPIVDATEDVTLNVTRRDINHADMKNPSCCAFARAACRTLEIVEARVHLGRTYLRTKNNEWLRFMTPHSARTEIVAFDRGGAFEPGTYTFKAPRGLQQLGSKAGQTSQPHKRSGKTRHYVSLANVRHWSPDE